MKKCKKKYVICLIIGVLFILNTKSLYANGWEQDGEHWKYKNDEDYVKGTHKLIDGKWYLFDENGHMVTGLYQSDDKFYYFGNDGTAANGPIEYKGKKYSISNKGEIKNMSEEEFYDYQDTLASLYIIGGGFDSEMNEYLKLGMEQAKNYFNTLPLSRSAFKKLFKMKGFNDDIITYFLNMVNINWKEQALKCAKDFYDKSQLNRVTMKEILIAEGFNEIEASYGTEMSFKNDTVSTGVGVKDKTSLLQDYIDRMSIVIIGEKVSDIEARKKIEQVTTTTTKIEETEIYKIVKKVKNTYQLNLTDDDAEKGKVKIKITLLVPEVEGPKSEEINALIKDRVFGEVEKYLEYNYYDIIWNSREYIASDVRISSQDSSSITLSFNGRIEVPLVIDLNIMQFKRDMVKY